MMDISINTLYVPLLIDYEKTESFFRNHYRKFSSQLRELINTIEDMTIIFHEFNNISNVICEMCLKFGEIKDIRFNIKKALGEIGERTTYYLKDMPLESAISALNEYFGKASFREGRKIIKPIDLSRSYFLRSKKDNKPFIFSIARVIDGAKGINYAMNSGFETNRCELGSDINNFILLRSLDADTLPFHTCVIDRNTIIEALEALDIYSIGVLEAWYELNLTSNKDVSRITEKILDRRYSDDCTLYKRAWNARRKALKELVYNIIKIQD